MDVPNYSVKYLGVVDGNMGILSRKMQMIQDKRKYGELGGSLVQAGNSLMKVNPSMDKKKEKMFK